MKAVLQVEVSQFVKYCNGLHSLQVHTITSPVMYGTAGVRLSTSTLNQDGEIFDNHTVVQEIEVRCSTNSAAMDTET